MAQYGGNGDGFDEERVYEIGRRYAEPVRKNFIRVLIVLVLAAVGFSAFFRVKEGEVGVITRFGAYVREVGSGLHMKAPLGIEQVWKVRVERQLKEEFGFRTTSVDVRSRFEVPEEAARESRMLTGDLNVADVEWIIQYRIKDPRKFLFNVRNLDREQKSVLSAMLFGQGRSVEPSTLRDMSEAAMRRVVGDHSVSEVLTVGREAIQIHAKEALQELCDLYDTGIDIQQLVLQDVNPPEPVQASFNEVNEAIQERERLINQAWTRYNSVIPEARGKAEQVIEAAEGYATERVNNARGEASRFLALQAEYAKAPWVTRARLYLETMSEVMNRAGKRIFVDDKIKGLLPVLPLDTVKGTVTP